MATESLIAQHVSRVYGNKPIVSRASLALEPGRVFALVGPSGAGKSTLLRLLAGLEPVDEGEVRIGDTLLSRPGRTFPPEKRRTGLIFQDFALFPHMTALRNVRFGLTGLARHDADREAAGWLARLGLETRAHAYPHQLSGGEQQRVAIARALAARPAAILMDEPFSGLDPTLRMEVAETALAAIRESAIPALLVSHDAPAAMECADDLCVMRGGELVQTGTPKTVYGAPNDSDIAAALGRVNLFPTNFVPPTLAPPGLALAPGGQLCVREEAVRIDPEGRVSARVRRHVFAGAMTRLVLDIDGLELGARVASHQAPACGETVKISLDPSLTFVFAGGTHAAST